jgi:hypothetical protein
MRVKVNALIHYCKHLLKLGGMTDWKRKFMVLHETITPISR